MARSSAETGITLGFPQASRAHPAPRVFGSVDDLRAIYTLFTNFVINLQVNVINLHSEKFIVHSSTIYNSQDMETT